jgi:hypothetical protein
MQWQQWRWDNQYPTRSIDNSALVTGTEKVLGASLRYLESALEKKAPYNHSDIAQAAVARDFTNDRLSNVTIAPNSPNPNSAAPLKRPEVNTTQRATITELCRPCRSRLALSSRPEIKR